MRYSKRFKEKLGSTIHTGRKKIDSYLLLEDVKKVIEKNNGDTRIATYRKEGMFSSSTVLRHFDGHWGNVLSAIGVVTGVTFVQQGPNWKERTCLGRDCEKVFFSWGSGNRLCSSCKTEDAFTENQAKIYSIYLSDTKIGKIDD